MKSIRRPTEQVEAAMVVLLALLFWAPDGTAGTDGPVWYPVVTAFHVHSKVSESGETLDQLAVEAKASGIDAIIFSDNFLLHYEYGLFPLRGVIRRTVDLPSLLTIGVDRYLAEMREAGLRHPDVMLIPGVEVVPHYYWTGSIFSKDLTMHDAQKNVLVLGLPRADDYDRMPAAGNHASYEYGWNTVVLLWPILLVPPAVWLINRRVERRLGTGWAFMVVRERRTAPGVALLALAVLLLINNYPFGTPLYDTYSDENGLRPHQGLIDYVQKRGGISIWSLPEAKDFSRHEYGRLGVVTVKTDPYPEALLQTSGYTGFGAVYEDTVTVTNPGGVWDAALMAYLEGRRGNPPWGVGEVAYHETDSAGKRLDNVETVLWVKERSQAALLDALAKGRMYALERRKDYGLVLKEFSLTSEETGQSQISGETLEAPANTPFRVRVEVSATDGQRRPVPVQVIRSGLVLSSTTETTPFSVHLRDVVPQGTGGYFRLLIGSADHRIVSNPIFVRSRASLTGALP
jgi:hypothetical protein